MRIDFLIVGAQKGGTSALSSFLAQHPDIFIPPQKEIHFFDNDQIFMRTDIDYELYHNYFQPKKQPCLLGEATPIYMFWKPAAKRIFEYNPMIKLIFILRNPVERAYSNYIMECKKKREFLRFKDALVVEPLRRLWTYPIQNRYHSYVERGFYTKGITRMMQYFPLSQMLFLKTEDLLMNHDQTLKKVFEFLKLPDFDRIGPKLVSSLQYQPMRNSEKQFLKKKFAKEIEELEVLLGWDLSDWKK
jgi:hypothetical protein